MNEAWVQALNSLNKDKKITILTAFQIYSMQNRDYYTRLNPHLKGTEITSLLAKIWKRMPETEKKQYEELSHYIRSKTIPEPQLKPIQYTFTPVIPKLFLVPRSSFGTIAAEVSNDPKNLAQLSKLTKKLH